MNLTSADYVRHLEEESARFAAVLEPLAGDEAVPTCPDWSADDLLWHLAEVQWFWSTIVRDGLTGPQAEAAKPPRPSGHAELAGFFRRSHAELVRVLAGHDPADPAWTWSDDQTVGFVQRRQTLEALIHRVDAEIAAGDRTHLDPRLSTDGIDEALRIMYGSGPDWGAFTADPIDEVGLLRIRTTDTGSSWLVRTGIFTGTDPGSGVHYPHEPMINVAAVDRDEPAAATISGRAEDLDCWLWNRPSVGPVDQAGDAASLERFQAVISAGIN